jgi:CPA1 family monovalent cation:H+ antiporter
VGIPFGVLERTAPFRNQTVKILTSGGLRGGIAVALALSFPASPYRGAILVATYSVVVFSIAVQGLTIRRLFGRWFEGV